MLDLAILPGEPIILIGLMESSGMFIGIGPLLGKMGLSGDKHDLAYLALGTVKRFLIFVEIHFHSLPSPNRCG